MRNRFADQNIELELAPQTKVEEFNHEIAILLDLLGHPEALVTDLTTFNHFDLTTANICDIRRDIGIDFSESDYLVDIAKKMRYR